MATRTAPLLLAKARRLFWRSSSSFFHGASSALTLALFTVTLWAGVPLACWIWLSRGPWIQEWRAALACARFDPLLCHGINVAFEVFIFLIFLCVIASIFMAGLALSLRHLDKSTERAKLSSDSLARLSEARALDEAVPTNLRRSGPRRL